MATQKAAQYSQFRSACPDTTEAGTRDSGAGFVKTRSASVETLVC